MISPCQKRRSQTEHLIIPQVHQTRTTTKWVTNNTTKKNIEITRKITIIKSITSNLQKSARILQEESLQIIHNRAIEKAGDTHRETERRNTIKNNKTMIKLIDTEGAIQKMGKTIIIMRNIEKKMTGTNQVEIKTFQNIEIKKATIEGAISL